MTKSNLVGVAGAYFVAGELSKKGYIALLTTRNTAGIDIIVSNPDTYKSTNIQVKATEKNDNWMLSAKDEKPHENLFFVLVDLRKTKPQYYVVPSKLVAKRIAKHHKEWLEEVGKKRPHKDTPIRHFRLQDSEMEKYRNNWKLMGLE